MRRIALPWEGQPRELAELSSAPRAPIAVVLPQAGAPRILTRGIAEAFALPTGSGMLLNPGVLGIGAGSASANTDTFRLHSVVNRTDTVWERPTTAVSIMVVFTRRGNSGGNAPLFGNMSPGISPYCAYGLFDSGGSGTMRFECSAGGINRGATAGISITNNKATVAIGTYGAPDVRLYQDGQLVGFDGGTGALLYPDDSVARGPALGNFWLYTGGSRSFVGDIFLAALWDVTLTDAEVAEYSGNPWLVFDPRSVVARASTAATFNPAWARGSNVILGGATR